MTEQEMMERLKEPFPPGVISWRPGSVTRDGTKAMALAYVDARDVQDRLDDVCGLAWQVRNPWNVNGTIACEIGIWSEEHRDWLWRGDGAGASEVEAEKGAFSDSFKRAAVRWGIGRYLYSLPVQWVAFDAQSKRFARDAEFKLPPWAIPVPREQVDMKMRATLIPVLDAVAEMGTAALQKMWESLLLENRKAVKSELPRWKELAALQDAQRESKEVVDAAAV